MTGNTYTDRPPLNTTVYAYRVSPTEAVAQNRVYSNVAFDQPERPAGLLASVEGANLVRLRWDKAIGSDVAGYNVYRVRGNEVRIEGAGKKLNSSLLNDPAYADATVDLSDSVARFYWVTAVNLAGKESGPSPYAMTFPDAPLAVNIDRHETQPAPTRDIRIWWEWPEDVKVKGFNVYFVDNHMNTHGKPAEVVNAWYRSWTKANAAPTLEAEYEDCCTWTPQLRVHLHHSLQQHRTSLLFLRSCGERVGTRGTEDRHHLENIGCVRSARPANGARALDRQWLSRAGAALHSASRL